MAEYVSLVSIQGKVEQSLNRAVKTTRTSLAGIQTPLNALSSFAVRDVESAIGNLGQQGQKAGESLANMVPKFKGVALAGGALAGVIAGLATAYSKAGTEAHGMLDAVTLSNINTDEYQQLRYLFQGFGGDAEKTAGQLTAATSSIARDLSHFATQGETIAKLAKGFTGTGFDIDVFRNNDPMAVLEETQRALAAGASEMQIRTGLGIAGIDTAVITEMIQASRDWERAAKRAADAPIISEDQLDNMASFSTMLRDVGTNLKVGILDEFHQLKSAGSGFSESNKEVLGGLELIGRFSLTSLVAGFKFTISIVDAAVTSVSNFVDAGKVGFNQLGKAWNESRIGILNLQNAWYSTQDAVLAGIEKVLGAASYLPGWLGGDKASEAQKAISSIRVGTQERLDAIEQAKQGIEDESAALDERNKKIRQGIYERGQAFQSRFQNDADEVTARFGRDVARTFGTAGEVEAYDKAVRSFESGGARSVQITNNLEINANTDLDSALRQIEESQLRQVQELVG